ncbi:hypothetical protein [Streptomyces sp. NPDC008121]|uniref:hypothetical protein n=1 Tax=Streptomyces sp. NPDC008121 TaxID=3364809 RepID=UPI0036EF176E
MALVMELRRGRSVSRAGRRPGPRPPTGMLERLVDDNDELGRVVERLGRHRLSSLARIDPYGDTTLHGEAVDRMVRELEGTDLARLGSDEREVVATLLAWGRRCSADRDLRIAFSGD